MQYMTPLQGSGDNKRSLVPGVDDPPVPPKKPRPDPKKPNKPPQKPSKIVVPDNCCSKTTRWQANLLLLQHHWLQVALQKGPLPPGPSLVLATRVRQESPWV